MDGQTDRRLDEGAGAEFPSGHQPQASCSTITEKVYGCWSPLPGVKPEYHLFPSYIILKLWFSALESVILSTSSGCWEDYLESTNHSTWDMLVHLPASWSPSKFFPLARCFIL